MGLPNPDDQGTLPETGMPSNVILLRAMRPDIASVFCLSNFLVWSFPPMIYLNRKKPVST